MLPKLVGIVRSSYDPVSTTQTNKLVGRVVWWLDIILGIFSSLLRVREQACHRLPHPDTQVQAGEGAAHSGGGAYQGVSGQ